MKKVFIDPGHGGQDPGASGYGLQEKDIALDIAKRTRRILLNNYDNVDVRLSRTKDVFHELSARADMANRWGADVFVSIHCNAGGGVGFESYRYISLDGNTETAKYQTSVHNNIFNRIHNKHDWLKNRGRKKANFAVLRETMMKAVLTENLFVDHERSAKLLAQSSFRELLARGHAHGIASYLGLQESDDGSEETVKRFGLFRKFKSWKLPGDEEKPFWQICQQGANYAYFSFENTKDLEQEVADLKEMVQELLDRE